MSAALPKNISLGFQLLLDAGGGAEAKWQKVFPLGETRHRDDFGSITFDKPFLEAMVRNYQAEGKPERPWDFFHRGSSSDKAVRNEDKVAAGWFRDVELRADGLWVLTEWTPRAKAHIDAKELRYPSPTFTDNAVDPKTGKAIGPKLLAVALLNDPFLTDLPAVEASAALPAAPKGKPMLVLSAIASALSLGADVTEENLETALKAKAEELATAKAQLVEMKAKVDAKDTAGGEAIRKLSEQVTALTTKLESQEKTNAAAAVTALTVKLESEGRITAAQKASVVELAAAVGLDKATSITSAWPVVVDLKERGTNKAGPADGMAPEEAHKQLQLKAAELAKAEPAKAGEAYMLAARANPELAKAAAKLTAKVQAERNATAE